VRRDARSWALTIIAFSAAHFWLIKLSFAIIFWLRTSGCSWNKSCLALAVLGGEAGAKNVRGDGSRLDWGPQETHTDFLATWRKQRIEKEKKFSGGAADSGVPTN
jgi:hypothetical protein